MTTVLQAAAASGVFGGQKAEPPDLARGFCVVADGAGAAYFFFATFFAAFFTAFFAAVFGLDVGATASARRAT